MIIPCTCGVQHLRQNNKNNDGVKYVSCDWVKGLTVHYLSDLTLPLEASRIMGNRFQDTSKSGLIAVNSRPPWWPGIISFISEKIRGHCSTCIIYI